MTGGNQDAACNHLLVTGLTCSVSRECRAAANFDHPGIVRVLKSGDIQGFSYQVIEFVKGERHYNTVRALAWKSDGQLDSSDRDGRILAWNSIGRVVRERIEPEGVHCLEFAPAGLRIPVPAVNPLVQETDSSSQTVSRPETETNSSVLTLQSDELLALGMNHGTVRLWHLPTDSVFVDVQHRGVEVRSVAFSPDGHTLAVAGSDQALYLWHVATGRNVLTFDRLGTAVNDVLFSPDGTILFAALHDGTIRTWHAPDEKAAENQPSRP